MSAVKKILSLVSLGILTAVNEPPDAICHCTLRLEKHYVGIVETLAPEMYSPQLSSSRGRSLSVSSSSSEADRSNAEAKGLEGSLLQLINDYNHTSLIVRQKTDKAKRDAIRNAVRVSNTLVDVVNGGVQESFITEKRIEGEIRVLAVTIARFMKQTDQWLTATHALNTALKEIGDFENWMKTMEYDCKSISAAIHNIHQE